MNQIKQNFKKINESKIFDRKVTLNQRGSGVFSFLLPMLTSAIIPSLISKGGKISKNNFFEVKSKYPSLYEKNYPLSNIFINNLSKNFKNFEACYSKDQIPLIEDNKSLIFNLQNSNQPGSHWISLSRKKIIYLYLIVLELVVFQLIYIKFIKIVILLQIYTEFKR